MLLLVPRLMGAIILFATLPLIKAQVQVDAAQSPSTASPTPTSTIPLPTSTSYTTYTSIYATTLTSGQPRPSGAPSSQSVFLATTTVTSALFTSASSPALPLPTSTTPVPSPSVFQEANLPLDTIIDPAFGILGVIFIITGASLAFIGHRSRWLICLISGFYSFALVTLCVILRVGVARSVDDPNKTLKGIYLIACVCAGGIGGAAFVIFRQGGLLLSSALGGFAAALYLQALKSDGIIQPVALRYILYVGFGTLAFSLACHPRLQAYVLIFSSAGVGSTTIILGIDCFTRANLKEFYIRNLGFDDLFEKKYPQEFEHHRWYLSTASIIELGVIGGLTLMAISFQGKMWAEFRTSLQLMRHDDEERRMQSKAKRAAKKIFASAQKDLREWEAKHGYRKTATRPEASDEDYMVQNVASSEMTAYQSKGSALSLLPMKASQSSTPGIEYPPALAYETNASESIGLLNSPLSGTTLNLRDSMHGTLGKEPLTAEQQRLLDEIANIRKSIDVLRSASPGTAMSASSDYQDPGKRASSALMMRTSTDELAAACTPSPWQSRERTRSITTIMQDSSVGPALFAGTDERFPLQRCSSPGLGYSVEEPQRPSSVMLNRLEAPSEEGRARADSDSRVLQNIAARFPMPHATEVGQSRSRDTLPDAKNQRRMSYTTVSSPKEGSRPASRIIVETKEEAAARYAKSIKRGAPQGGSKKSNGPASPIEPTQTRKVLSMGELQMLHEKRLSALQRPASTKVLEEASLIKAKEDWNRRSLLEKRRWEGIAREQRQTEESQKMPAAEKNSATLLDLPQQSGVSRAREWRNSMAAESKPSMSEAKQRRRHSAHSQPLLDFTAETIQEESRQTQRF